MFLKFHLRIQDSKLRGETRFQNKRALVTAEARKLFQLLTVATENTKDLEILHRKINSCTSNLEMYGIDTSNWDLIFILLCSDKLPASTVTLWEQTLADKTANPKWSHFNEFLLIFRLVC